MQSYSNDSLQIHPFLGQASPSLALVIKTPTDYDWLVWANSRWCSNLHSDTTLLQPNRTNTPVHTGTEQYTYIQSPAPEDECYNIRNMLSNKKLS